MKNKIRNHIALLAVGLMTAATTQAELVGHWTFDETSGTNAVDSSGNGYDGTVVNPVWADGVIGGALKLNGTDCSVSGFSTNLFSTVSNELTIAFWCLGAAGDPQPMNPFSGYDVVSADNANRKLNSHLPYGATVYWDANSGVDRERIQKNWEDESQVRGAWNHWAFTKDASIGVMSIYLNGDLWHDNSDNPSLTNHLAGIQHFFIGSERGASTFYKGLMDDFRVYDNVLSETEISDLYSSVRLDYTVASFMATPDNGVIPLEVVFDGSSSVSSTNIIDYSWDFGDGSTGNGVIVSHTYTTVSTNTVTLTITDESGNTDSAQLELETRPVPPIEISYSVESSDFADMPSFSTNDLAQTYYANSTGTVDNPTRLFDGLIMSDPAVEGDQTTDSKWTAGETVTVDFDLSVNTLGYVITNVTSIAGWPTGGGGRSNQGYELRVTYIDGSQEVIAEATYWAPNSPAAYWTKVSLFEKDHGVMASGVKSVTINFTEDANAGGVVLGREIDILGVPVLMVPTIAVTNNASSLTWNSNGEFLYTVQTNLSLPFGEWGTLMNVKGTPPQTTVDLPTNGPSSLFYRVISE